MTKERILLITLCLASSLASAPGAASTAVSDAPVPPATAASAGESAAIARVAGLLDAWDVTDDGMGIKAELDAILAANPRSAAAHREYARYQIKHGYDHDEVLDPAAIVLAQRSLDQALAIDPGLARAYVLQGHVYWLAKRPAEARIALAKAEAIGTSDPWLELNWAEVLRDDRDFAAIVPRCKRVLANREASSDMKWLAEDCLIKAYYGLNRMDDVAAVHRARIARVPGEAFAYGNFASFQLCSLDQPEAAVVSATQALRLKTYLMAQHVVVAARYRIWSREVYANEPVKAAAAWDEASRAPQEDPAALIGDVCNDHHLALQTLRALRSTGRGVRVVPMMAVLAAASEAGDSADGGDGIDGIFVFKVAATGRQGDNIYLNSEADYRDQRNLTVHITPKTATAFNKLHGVDLDASLKGQYISVVGTARRTRINFTTNGQPTGRFYYQTQVVVWDPTDVRIEDPLQPLLPQPKPAAPAIDA